MTARGCGYVAQDGTRCGKAAKYHGIVISGPDDGDTLGHPVLQGDGPWARRLSARWRIVNKYGLAGLEPIEARS